MPRKTTGNENRQTKRYWIPVLLAVLVAVPVMTGAAVAQDANQTSTENSTPTADSSECQVEGPPPLERTRVYLEDNTIEQGDPGKISLQHVLDTSYNCPVTVLATIYAPNGVELSVSGGGTVEQFEGGAQAMFTIDPTTGGTVGTSSIEVYYDGEVNGEREITIDGTAQLFPEGYRSQSEYHTDIGGLSESLTVVESTTPEPTSTPHQSQVTETGSEEVTEGVNDDPADTGDELPVFLGGIAVFIVVMGLVTKL